MPSSARETSSSLAERLERAVADAERRTAAEFAVVFVRESGDYRDVEVRAGAIFAALAVGFMIFAPFNFHEWGIPPNAAIFFGLGWLAAHKFHPPRRWLTTSRRRRAQARAGAELAMARQAVHHTTGRTGVLIYVSWFERRAEIVADVGVSRCVPRHEWNLAAARLAQAALARPFPDAFVDALSDFAATLAPHLPPVDQALNEISNRPVLW